MNLLKLPTEAGTVIAIGQWWFVRLGSYEGAPPAWEMLPLPSADLSEKARRNGFPQQCVYSDEIVLAEAEQEGGFLVIAEPSAQPRGVRYYTRTPEQQDGRTE